MTRNEARRARFGQRMSSEEWAELPEDEPGELVAGRLVEDEVPGPVHENVVTWLTAVVDRWVDPLGGFTLGSGAKFRLGPKLGRMCDLSVFLPGSAYPVSAAIAVPPDIMVEIVSRRPRDMRRDRIRKAREYARFGVGFYWIIDPTDRTLEGFVLDAAKQYVRVIHASGGLVELPGCPGLRVDLDGLWARVDRFKPVAPTAPRRRGRAKKTGGARA